MHRVCAFHELRCIVLMRFIKLYFVTYILLDYVKLYCVDMVGVATEASAGPCCDDTFHCNLATFLGSVLSQSKVVSFTTKNGNPQIS